MEFGPEDIRRLGGNGIARALFDQGKTTRQVSEELKLMGFISFVSGNDFSITVSKEPYLGEAHPITVVVERMPQRGGGSFNSEPE
ncbi:hypothetical protein A2985_02340 [Candidatus Woesebacteria bacterium RIFCSPLOWO2_01_FULL_43_11]|uniref:Uncharacterized protein n=1 Tax=Candidatus Woesebacteria bacterium RBG_16_42_24 TaxID=1802485 RepID=A0A1F7XKE4_9BACT|nr:MAG: hypothetical protein A2V97_02480 [Candidatus Woesebacteria bacterium RBG_16_42_24]OGM68352.1 MAG: hypothetical protein A2985_02340 [Candidatus Woesebacteria bacterium RIFCSPLOWO2_01_FULL_43_11]